MRWAQNDRVWSKKLSGQAQLITDVSLPDKEYFVSVVEVLFALLLFGSGQVSSNGQYATYSPDDVPGLFVEPRQLLSGIVYWTIVNTFPYVF